MEKELKPLPRQIVERLDHSLGEDLEKTVRDIYGIWVDFLRGPQTPEAKEARKTGLMKVLEAASDDVRKELEELTNGKNFLAAIRDIAQQNVHKVSNGVARFNRRQKAFKRRGTDPRYIH